MRPDRGFSRGNPFASARVVQDVNLRGLGGGSAFVRFKLPESGGGVDARPRGFVEPPVDGHLGVDAVRGHGQRLVRLLLNLGIGITRCKQNHHHQPDAKQPDRMIAGAMIAGAGRRSARSPGIYRPPGACCHWIPWHMRIQKAFHLGWGLIRSRSGDAALQSKKIEQDRSSASCFRHLRTLTFSQSIGLTCESSSSRSGISSAGSARYLKDHSPVDAQPFRQEIASAPRYFQARTIPEPNGVIAAR